MFSLSTVLILLFVHFVADFIFQNDYMALGKSESLTPLFYHACVYQAVMSLGFGLVLGWDLPSHIALVLCTFSFAAHFVTDYWTSRLNKKLWKLPSKHWFFVSVGFDQFIHFATLFLLISKFSHA